MSVTLLCGKFEELTDLPKIGLVFMDPPDGEGRGYDVCPDRWRPADYRNLLRRWLARACQVTTGPVFLSFAERWIADVEEIIRAEGLRLVQRCWWYYTFGQCHTRRYSPCLRPVYWLNSPQVFPAEIKVPSARQAKYGDKRAADGGKMPDNVWQFSRICGTFRERRKWHPTQHPESLLARIVLGHTRPGDVVLDPFVGSGTTAYVCDALGRDCIGIDVSQGYLDKIAEELARRARREGAA